MSSRRVRLHPDFEADVRAQIDWLVTHRQARWLDNLDQGLQGVVELLSAFPGAGAVVGRREGRQLRRLLFRKGPYLVWYVVDGNDVWLLRLFHARQRRPAPNPARWFRR
ncbi:MAG: type II toxin-antitoxin system RelE/ParE family toxin [Myxococcales bacterium]|nr:type II toxin-antitoxin system RelE/ParE family toxin [Myxococcales bacterium]